MQSIGFGRVQKNPAIQSYWTFQLLINAQAGIAVFHVYSHLCSHFPIFLDTSVITAEYQEVDVQGLQRSDCIAGFDPCTAFS